MITPYDINLILEEGETRRFFDALIAQFDKIIYSNYYIITNYLNKKCILKPIPIQLIC